MSHRIDITGRRFGRWVVVRIAGRYRTSLLWECLCDCGTVKNVKGSHLRSGGSQSCGCLTRDLMAKKQFKHGCANRRIGETREYRTWTLMKRRVTNQNDPSYPNYGGRGVTVCTRWMQSFEAFLADMGPCPSVRHSIDRKDNDGNYDPDNCRWATLEEQANNRRSNIVVQHNGQPLTLKQFCNKTGAVYTKLHQRIRAGWPVERALYS